MHVYMCVCVCFWVIQVYGYDGSYKVIVISFNECECVLCSFKVGEWVLCTFKYVVCGVV